MPSQLQVESMLETLTTLFIGLAIGFTLKELRMEALKGKLNDLISTVVVALLFVMGFALGSNNEIARDLTVIGYGSTVLASLTFLASVVFGYMVWRWKI